MGGSSKHVRFAESTDCVSIPHHSQVSPQVVAQTWYRQDDLVGIAAKDLENCFFLLANKQFLATDALATDTDVCLRGLEHIFMPSFAKTRLQIATNATKALLKEQDRQLLENSFDADLLAAAYIEVSLLSSAFARFIAIQDELDMGNVDQDGSLLEVQCIPSSGVEAGKVFATAPKPNEQISERPGIDWKNLSEGEDLHSRYRHRYRYVTHPIRNSRDHLSDSFVERTI